MANVITVQTIEDGPRNSVFKVDLTLDTSNLANTVIWDPAARYTDPPPMTPTNSCVIQQINYMVQDTMAIQLLWDAAAPKSICHLEGRGVWPLPNMGGIPNNATTPTGKILLAGTGWVAAAVLSATLHIWVTKSIV